MRAEIKFHKIGKFRHGKGNTSKKIKRLSPFIYF